MTAGPTQVRENVRMARSLECTNPDLDMEFFDFYHETCAMLSKVTNTENKALILGGEGILGLEAACASLTEPGDRVLDKYGIMISGCFDVLAGKVVRIGHMGENCYVEQVVPTLQALQGMLEKLGIPIACDLAKTFLTEMEK